MFEIHNVDIVEYLFQFLNFQEQSKLASVSRVTNQIVNSSIYHSVIRKTNEMKHEELSNKCIDLIREIKKNASRDVTFDFFISSLLFNMYNPQTKYVRFLTCLTLAEAKFSNDETLKRIIKQVSYCEKFKEQFSIQQPCDNIDYSIMLSVQFKLGIKMSSPYSWFVQTNKEDVRTLLAKLEFKPKDNFNP